MMAINPHEAIGEHVRARILLEEETRRQRRIAETEGRLDQEIKAAGRDASEKGERSIRVGATWLRYVRDLIPDIIKRYEAAGWIVEHETEQIKRGKAKWVENYLRLTAPIQVTLRKAEAGAPKVRHAQAPGTRRSGYVYLLEAENGLFKIGRSKQPKFRISEITKAVAPFEIKEVHKAWYPDCHAVESALHRRFAKKRKRGEWFALSAEEAREVINHAFSPA
jgi:hypothetical protein